MSNEHTHPVGDGVLEEREDQTMIRFERHLAHPIERVWAALTEPVQLIAWWAEADIELVEGGRFNMWWLNTDEAGQRYSMQATVSRLDPPHLLETRGEPHGLLRWELKSDGAGGTVLTFTNVVAMAGEEVPADYRAGARTGWHYHLDAMVDHLEGRPVELAELPNDRWNAIHASYTQAS